MSDLSHSEGIAAFIANACLELKNKQDMDAVRRLVGKYESIRSMALIGYKIGLSELGSIEQLPIERKNQLWDMSKEFTKGKYRVDWCKCMHYLEAVI